MAVEIGQKAPSFQLYSSEKKLVSLEDYKGSCVLLLFFPLAFTSVCTKELCSVRDQIGFYDHLDAKVIGISVDSLYTLAKFKAEQGLNFVLLSDFNKEVSVAYDCLYPAFGYGMKGVSKRAAFVIDREANIQYAEVMENAGEIPDFEAITDKIRNIS
jgi:peroxiredoxin